MVEFVSTPKVPGFMISNAVPRDGDEPWKPEETPGEVFREQWGQFVDLLHADGPGTGYERLLALQKNLEARRKEFVEELRKWQDRKDRLGKLKGHYHLKLQELAGVENPSPIWRTRGANDPVEQLPSAAQARADEPIVEAFADFDGDGRLEGKPELDDGWKAYAENISLGWLLDGTAGEFVTDGPEPRRENMTVRYRLSEGELERAGIEPDNLESPRSAIETTPSTTWREALVQIEEREQEMKEEMERPKRTLRVLDFRMDVLENVLYRFETFGSVEALTEADAQEIAEESQPGRKTTLNDPEAHPSVMLKAVLEWTDDDANRKKPFRSETKPSLCGHVSERLEEPAGYSVSQETIKSRLRSIMNEMDVQLPHGPTNKLSYFQAREEITEAMKEHDLV